MGVVGEVDRTHLDHRVVVDEVVQPGGAHHECRHDLAPVALLAGAGDHPGLDQVDHGIGEHLGVNAQVTVAAQGQGGGGRDRPDAQLDRRPVGDQLGDVLANPALDLADRAAEVLVGRHVHLDRQVDLVNVDEALAQGPGHRAVELDDDGPGRPNGSVHRLDRHSQ